jgi:DNA polymerase-3 subunit alpha
MSFVHLHSHTHYSLLDGAGKIPEMVARAAELKMPGLAITDHGNLFGAIEFYKACKKVGIKPLIGMEAYITAGSRKDRNKDLGKRDSAHLILIAKDKVGYDNLIYLSSLAYLEGFYRRPRIDHELLRQHSQGLIATSACMNGEVAQAIRIGDKKLAMANAEKYVEIFGDDFYLEIQDHGIPGEKEIYDQVYNIGREMNIPVVATNDNHYLHKDHWESHDVLLCLQTGKDLEDPHRLRYNTTELYLKTADEMYKLFRDRSETLDNTMAIHDKVNLDLVFGENHLPEFPIPISEGNINLDQYLAKLSREGLAKRYDNITPELEERLTYELGVIEKMGFAGYFLIVMDFIKAAKEMDIPVGLGRGSAAGSLVAYALEITAVDPIKYGLLFERFLNPERVTMPDIDIDFCFERRDEVIEYVRKKYGKDNVAQIITFGTLASKNALKDVARTLKISFDESNKLSQKIPVEGGRPWSLKRAFNEVDDLKIIRQSDNPTYQALVRHSQVLEGIARQPGIHAAGVIIAPDDIKKYVPLYKNSDDDVTTQYSMKYLEELGLLKMDFLGLRTLTVLHKCIKMIERRHQVRIDLQEIPLDDAKTYALFSRGETTGVFQFESLGMKKHLINLKPSRIEDLIAMNALYRPGPMQFIENYVRRKFGKEKIEYLHPDMQGILEETYGIMIYQEQVMQVVSKVAGFSLGAADVLRRAMGKKKLDIMEKMKGQFIEGCQNNAIKPHIANQIWDQILEFAKYGFNKSHSAAYALIAYQTGYLKAHYTAEFLSAVMSSEISQSDRIQLYMEEARRLGIKVLPPDINHSYADFSPADAKTIAFGMEAIKNVGKKPIKSIATARKRDGKFTTIFDFVERIDLRLVNRKVLESLVQAGAMDSLKGSRAQNFRAIEAAIDFGGKIQQSAKDKDQTSMFDGGEAQSETTIVYPDLPDIEPWDKSEMLKREFDLLGFYLTDHPLEEFREELATYSNFKAADLDKQKVGDIVKTGGLITAIKRIVRDNRKDIAFMTIESFAGSYEVTVYSEVIEKAGNVLVEGKPVFIIAKIQSYKDQNRIIAEQVFPLDQVHLRLSGGIRLELDSNKLNSLIIREINTIFDVHRKTNGLPVFIHIKTAAGNILKLKPRNTQIHPNEGFVSGLNAAIGSENVIFLAAK